MPVLLRFHRYLRCINMNRILLITRREYLSRVKKKSFLIMTLLGPLLIGLFYGLIFYFVLNPDLGSDSKKIGIYNFNDSIFNSFESDAQLQFSYLNPQWNADSALKKEFDAILIIPKLDTALNLSRIDLKCKKKPGLGIKNSIQRQLESMLTDAKLRKNGLITRKEFEKYNASVKLNIINISDKSDDNGQEVAAGVGLACAFLIYIFIFLYGVQVMRGVIEEKTNRIVEVIISSVKPFELMLGKIIGIALVGLTQFSVWLIFGFMTVTFGGSLLHNPKLASTNVPNAPAISQISQLPVEAQTQPDMLSAILNINYPLVLGCFLFFFITGYLFYGALFASIGAAVDSETDTQQFMLPVTMPLVFGFIIATSSVVNDYNSTLAKWLSVIPFTAPVVTMVRVPFMNEFNSDILLSMFSMVISFILVVWMAGKIYRTGILMYGKKATYREIFKWLRYH